MRYSLILAVLFSSCLEKDHIDQSNFSKVIDIEATPIDGINLYCVSSINAFDSLLILVENCDETVFHVYNISDFSPVGSFASLGNGPNEFGMPDMQNQIWKEGESILGIALDLQKLKTYTIDITRSVSEDRMVVNSEYDTPVEAGGLISSVQHASGVSVIASAEGSPGVIFHDEEIGKVSFVDDFPKISKPYPKSKDGILYNSVVRIKPDGSKMVRAMDLFHRVDVYSIDKSLDFSIQLDQEKEPDLSNPNVIIPEEIRRYYVGLFLTDNYIYALNWNMTFGEFNNDVDVKTQLEVFDWEGSPICLYKFDQKVATLAVDEKNKRIIGINDLKENPFIYYNIGNELQLLN